MGGTREYYLSLYHPEEYGCWKILGEDPNFDLGGCHHQPDLGNFKGTYKNIVNYAFTFPSWGYGGDIKKIKSGNYIDIDKLFNSPKVQNAITVKLANLLAEKEKLELLIEEHNKSIKKIDLELKILRSQR